MAIDDLPSLSQTDADVASASEIKPPNIPGYRIRELLGRGGMGVVWKAIQLDPKREVALKHMNPQALGSETARARFRLEVEVAAQLEHPHIARMYDSQLSWAPYFFTMELVRGQRLDQYVQEHKLDTRQIMQLMHTVAVAVAYAHQNGVMHRDLKPSNILVSSDGEPHIVDFGVAKRLADQDTHLTVSDSTRSPGTPVYMAPEQVTGKTVDTRTDIYSLGVTAYELLTGRLPYDLSGSEYERMKTIERSDPIPPRRLVPGIDSDLEAILLKALAKEPYQRYQTMAQFAEDIQRRLEGLPVWARSATAMYMVRKWVSRHKAATAVAGLVTVILASTTFISTYALLDARATNKRLQDSIRRRESERENMLNMLHYAAFDFFLREWQHDESEIVGQTLRYLAPGSREQRAARWLLDPRPLEQKLQDIKQYLAGDEQHFWNFVLGEYYLNSDDKQAALEAYYRCSRADQDPNDPRYWYLDKARKRVDQLRPAGGE